MWDDLIQCELCSARVSIEQIAVHLAQHESHGKINSLKNEQDCALEESILLDIQRLSEEESTRQAELAKERKAAELKEMEEALAISVSEAHRVERELAAKNLLPEPDSDYPDSKVVLKFILSDTNKLKRTFRASSPVQDAFLFLRAKEELEGKRFVLRNAVNTLSLEAGDMRSFEQAGVLTSTSLLVVPVAVPEANPSEQAISLTSSSSNSSSSGAGGAGRITGKRPRAAITSSAAAGEVVVDLLSPQPPRKAPAGSREGSGGGSGSGGSGGASSNSGAGGASRPALFTPHRSSGDAVIDLTLS